jgi:integrase/recombinase XerD
MQNLDLLQLKNNYIHYCTFQRRLSSKTIKAYALDLEQFFKFSKSNFNPFSRANLTNYLCHLNKTYAPQTAKRKIASLKAFFNYLVYEGILSSSPMAQLKTKFCEPKVLPKTIPLITIRELLEYMYYEFDILPKTSLQYKHLVRDISVVELLLCTGLRVSELCSLKQSNIDFHNKSIHICGKGSRERVVYVENNDVLKILKTYHQLYFEEISIK